jgi:hypothetical protein
MKSGALRWILLALVFVGCAELAQFGGPEREAQLTAGVREVLRVAAERGVSRASRPGGFLENPAARIALPPELAPIATALRAVGLRGTVEEIERSMNRAAEQASGEAADLLLDAVEGLSIQDARTIIYGDDAAATRYLRSRTEDALRARFAPIVAVAMKRVGLYRAYDELIDRNRMVSALPDPALSLEEYVTAETVDGLFAVLREEEGRIRDDPAARTTALLREVFGSR